MSLMASFYAVPFPRDVLDEIWDLIESVSEGYSSKAYHPGGGGGGGGGRHFKEILMGVGCP